MTNYQNKKINIGHLDIATKMLHGGIERSNFGETSEAIFLNSGFCYNSAEIAESRFNGEDPSFVYSRYLNPTLKILEDKLALLEGAEKCSVMASGMAAVFASIMCQAKAGDHIIFSKVLFGSCYYIANNILSNYGIEISFVAGTDLKKWQQAFKKNTKLVFIETPANPNLEIIDIRAVANLCKNFQAKLIIDNIFASPYCQKPLDLGADIVVYSTTKHLDGQGRTLGGCVISNDKEFIEDILIPFYRHTGPALSPFNAWVVIKSLETFNLRMKQHCENALQIAKFLENHPKVKKVFYPSLKSHAQFEIAQKQMKSGGAMIAFEVNGGKDFAFKSMNKLNLIKISNNLGDSRSLITHPATTTHSNIDPEEQLNLGITSGMCRLSVGIENVNDLIKDIDQSL
jgi:O-succinylhomoserine sulfhydrylase